MFADRSRECSSPQTRATGRESRSTTTLKIFNLKLFNLKSQAPDVLVANGAQAVHHSRTAPSAHPQRHIATRQRQRGTMTVACHGKDHSAHAWCRGLRGRRHGRTGSHQPTDPQPTCAMCPGTMIPLAELEAYTKKAIAEKLVDQRVRDIDIGKAHIGIGMVYRTKLDKPEPNSVAEHDQVSEVYHIISGQPR